MNPATAVVAILVGVVPIAAAIVSIVPSLGRLRRLERIVDLIPKVDDQEARDRLKVMRDRIITAMEPKARSKRVRLSVLLAVSYGVLLLGFAMWVWSPLKTVGTFVELVGAAGILVAFLLWVPRLFGFNRELNKLGEEAADIRRRQDRIEAAFDDSDR